jgi:outer membrane protein assembly factor BamB
VPGSPAQVPEVPDDTTYAAPTMATDGRRVYAIFANGDLGAFSLDGTPAWAKYLGPWKNPYGYATSLAMWRSNLVVQLDQGDSETEGSKLVSLDGASGRVVWERSRPAPASWASPLVTELGGKTQIITLANPWVIAYAPADGGELWRAHLLEGEVVPSPGLAGGLILVINPGSALIALRADGSGDVTKTKVAWSTDENVPDITSPVGSRELVFTVSSIGLVTCFQAADGKKIWEKNLDLDARASPSLVGGRLLIVDGSGIVVALEAGRKFHELARSRLPDKFLASPAFAGGRVFLRGETNLFCLGAAGAKAEPAK